MGKQALQGGEAVTKERCGFRFDHDPVTLLPRGRRCGRVAVEIIQWKDGRWSPACAAHGIQALTEDARYHVARVRTVEASKGMKS